MAAFSYLYLTRDFTPLQSPNNQLRRWLHSQRPSLLGSHTPLSSLTPWPLNNRSIDGYALIPLSYSGSHTLWPLNNRSIDDYVLIPSSYSSSHTPGYLTIDQHMAAFPNLHLAFSGSHTFRPLNNQSIKVAALPHIHLYFLGSLNLPIN